MVKSKADHLRLVQDKPVRKNRGRKVFRNLLCLLLLIALLFLLREGEAFFRISNITVIGAGEVSQDDIIKASGIDKGNSIFLVSESKILENVKSEYPVIKNISISRQLPDSITVEVFERRPAGYVMTADGFWMIDREAVCFSYSGEPVEGLPLITGVEGRMVIPGFPLDCPARKELLIKFFDAGIQYDWLEILQLDLTNSFNLVLHIAGEKEIWLGDGKKLDQKLMLVRESLAHLPHDTSTTLDVRSGSRLVVSKKENSEEKEVDQ